MYAVFRFYMYSGRRIGICMDSHTMDSICITNKVESIEWRMKAERRGEEVEGGVVS